MKKTLSLLLTIFVVAVAVLLVALKYFDYVANPWTRDGQVRANVIQVTSRVSGPITELPISDNQMVKAGDLLFRIDPRTYQVALAQAKAQYDQTVDQLDSLDRQVEAADAQVQQASASVDQAQAQLRSAQAALVQSTSQLERYDRLVKDGNISIANYDAQKRNYDVDRANVDRSTAALSQATSALAQAQAQRETVVAKRGAKGDDNAQLRSAKANLENARLNLEFTEQRASVDGYVTNLNLQLGSQANAGSPAMALVDKNSFWVDAYFRESVVGTLKPGNAAFVTLMSYPDTTIEGTVDSIAWGISQQDGSTSQQLLPVVQPSFEWIRLAQRIPVKIMIKEVPANVELRVGTTASVMVRASGHGSSAAAGTSAKGAGSGKKPPPVPAALQ